MSENKNASPNSRYSSSPFKYSRCPTRCLKIGKLSLGGDSPIRIQSMTTTNTMDTSATVKQSMALFDAGADLVRITAPGPKDAENLGAIKAALSKRGYEQALVADIHFSPKTAMIALEHVEKVRINPGNFVDRKRFETREYTDEQYQEELEALKESFLPLVRRAKALKRVLRIGSNHGSLSDRIMNRYGDTPLGMIESALEFIRFAREEEYYDIVVSMKSSNPRVMVQAYRRLNAYFYEHGYDYPLHLGVTEAGGGRDGRMKSALGIGTLLMDGMGDTIRVSLTEDPVQEIYAAQDILKSMEQAKTCVKDRQDHIKDPKSWERAYGKQVSFYKYKAVASQEIKLGTPKLRESQLSTPVSLGAKKAHLVFVSINQSHHLSLAKKEALRNFQEKETLSKLSQSEWREKLQRLQSKGCNALWSYDLPKDSFVRAAGSLNFPWVQDLGIMEAEVLNRGEYPIHAQAAAVSLDLDLKQLKQEKATIQVLQTKLKEKKQVLFLHCIIASREAQDCLEFLSQAKLLRQNNIVLSLSVKNQEESFHSMETAFAYRLLCAYKEKLVAKKEELPSLLLRGQYNSSIHALTESSIYLGGLLLDGIGNALFLEIGGLSLSEKLEFQLDILQAARLRLSKTEYISCPSCGRTLFDLEETTARIRKRTGHLKGLKIAVMGCIVNGPGEMADADFGYVGAGPGKVHLYHEKKLVKANVPTQKADEELVLLIQENRAWQNPKDS